MTRRPKVDDDLFKLTADHFRRDPTDPDTVVIDPDIALVVDWYRRELSPAQMQEVARRLHRDDAFWDKVAPVMLALTMPVDKSAPEFAEPEIDWAGEGEPWTRDDVRREFILACQTIGDALRKHPAAARIAAKIRHAMFE